MKSPPPPIVGIGALAWRRDPVTVDYEIRFSADVTGRRAAKGAVTGEPDAMREAFRAGYARLRLDDGQDLEVQIVAHSDGAPTAYFQTR